MATGSPANLNLQVTHDHTKYTVTVTCEHPDGPTVRHLAQEVEKVTGVPVTAQRLIYKARTLRDQFESLRSLGIKDGSKIMVVGKKVCTEDDTNMKKMRQMESQVEKTGQKLQEIDEEFQGVVQGYLAKELQESALTKMSQRTKLCIEEYTRFLESLDALILANSAPEVKAKRKAMVASIQSSLDRCDTLREGLKGMVAKLNS